MNSLLSWCPHYLGENSDQDTHQEFPMQCPQFAAPENGKQVSQRKLEPRGTWDGFHVSCEYCHSAEPHHAQSVSGEQRQEVVQIPKALLCLSAPSHWPCNQQTTGHSESHNRNRKSWNKKSKMSSCSLHSILMPVCWANCFLLCLYLNQKVTLGFNPAHQKAGSFLAFCHHKNRGIEDRAVVHAFHSSTWCS